MKKYIKKPEVIDAYIWYSSGKKHEGVQHYALSDSEEFCLFCTKQKKEHGLVKTENSFQIACSGDFVCKNNLGYYFVCKPSVFKAYFEEINERR